MGGEVGSNQILFLWWKGNPGNKNPFSVWKEEPVGAKVGRKLLQGTHFRNHWEHFADCMTAHWGGNVFLTWSKKCSPEKKPAVPDVPPSCSSLPPVYCKLSSPALFIRLMQILGPSRIWLLLFHYKNLKIFRSFLSDHFLDLDLISELFIHSGLAACLLSINQHWSPSS